MERINGSITAAIKSRQKPDEHIGTILEIDSHLSLLPFVIPGMQTVFAKNNFSDQDGRLLIHKIFRQYVRFGGLGEDDSDDDEANPAANERPKGRMQGNQREKVIDGNPSVPLAVLESFLTSDDSEFSMDKDQIEAEFGVKLSADDIRRAIRRIGDVTLVDKVHVKPSEVLLEGGQYKKLRQYIKDYLDDSKGSTFDFLFEWDQVDSADEWDENPVMQHVCPDASSSLIKGNHHPGIKFTKWKNVRFENTTRFGDFNLVTRSLRISGSRYDKRRVRLASFFEFSTDNSIKFGSHSVGDKVERAASSRVSDHAREFAEALFFMTVDFDWDLILNGSEAAQNGMDDDTLARLRAGINSLPKALFLCCSKPISVRFEDGLTILNKVPPGAVVDPVTRRRRYKEERWIDVDDFVDIVGFLYCRGDEYVCWRDGSWDPIVRQLLDPLDWRFKRHLESQEMVSATVNHKTATSSAHRQDTSTMSNQPEPASQDDSEDVEKTSSVIWVRAPRQLDSDYEYPDEYESEFLEGEDMWKDDQDDQLGAGDGRASTESRVLDNLIKEESEESRHWMELSHDSLFE